jgi:hypothetical protein
VRELAQEKLTRKWFELRYKEEVASELLLISKYIDKKSTSKSIIINGNIPNNIKRSDTSLRPKV